MRVLFGAWLRYWWHVYQIFWVWGLLYPNRWHWWSEVLHWWRTVAWGEYCWLWRELQHFFLSSPLLLLWVSLCQGKFCNQVKFFFVSFALSQFIILFAQDLWVPPSWLFLHVWWFIWVWHLRGRLWAWGVGEG